MEDLDKAIDWFQRNGSIVRFEARTPIPRDQLVGMKDLLSKISFSIRKDFPEYADRLFSLKNSLALPSGIINVSTFGRLSESLSFIKILLEKYKKHRGNIFILNLVRNQKKGFYMDFMLMRFLLRLIF